jgi:hypothetical protein
VSPPPPIYNKLDYYAFTKLLLLFVKKYPVQVALSLHRPVESSAVPSSADMGIMAPRRLHLARLQLEQESILIPRCQHDGRGTQHREGEGVPLIVFLEPLVLGVLPASALAIMVTLLGVLGVVACSVLPCVLGGVPGEVLDGAWELVFLGE